MANKAHNQNAAALAITAYITGTDKAEGGLASLTNALIVQLDAHISCQWKPAGKDKRVAYDTFTLRDYVFPPLNPDGKICKGLHDARFNRIMTAIAGEPEGFIRDKAKTAVIRAIPAAIGLERMRRDNPDMKGLCMVTNNAFGGIPLAIAFDMTDARVKRTINAMKAEADGNGKALSEKQCIAKLATTRIVASGKRNAVHGKLPSVTDMLNRLRQYAIDKGLAPAIKVRETGVGVEETSEAFRKEVSRLDGIVMAWTNPDGDTEVPPTLADDAALRALRDTIDRYLAESSHPLD